MSHYEMDYQQQEDLRSPEWKEEAEALYYREGDLPWKLVASGPTLDALPGFEAAVSDWKKRRVRRSMGHHEFKMPGRGHR